jgi:uncharacterized protein (TIGR00290 family)
MKVVALWSGGKDSLFAFYKAKEKGLNVRYLLNFLSSRGDESFSHHISPHLISLQAESIGITLIKRPTYKLGYERAFKETILELKEEGIEGGIFGDIYLEEHRSWVDRVCKEIGIEPLFPLWMRPTIEISNEFIDSGFEAMVVCAKAGLFPKEWLGRMFDRGFVADLCQEGIDPCGERGEFHTFVVDGPLFKERIEIRDWSICLKDGRWCLDINGDG